MSTESKLVPETQVAPSGGPPKPPKKTARGLEDGAPDPESEVLEIEKRLRETRDRVTEQLTEQLLDPSLPDVKRAQLEKHLKAFKKGQSR